MNANQGTTQSSNQRQDPSSRAERSINLAEIALRGTSTLIDIQLAGWRNMAQIQARSAAVFGLPACTELFNAADNLVKSQLSATTDQLLNSTRQLAQAYSETNRQFGRVIQQSANQMATEIRRSMEEVGQRTRQSMQELTNMAERQANEVERELEATQQSNAQTRNGDAQAANYESGEMQFRQPDEGSGRKGTAQQQPSRKK